MKTATDDEEDEEEDEDEDEEIAFTMSFESLIGGVLSSFVSLKFASTEFKVPEAVKSV